MNDREVTRGSISRSKPSISGMLSVTALILSLIGTSLALDNGLGRTPGMGWNSDYCTNCSTLSNGYQNEAFILNLSTYIANSKFKALGYHYINMDASWDLKDR